MVLTAQVSASTSVASNARRLDAGAFVSSPALANASSGRTALAFLSFDGDAERVRLTVSSDPLRGAWSAPVDVSPPGVVFPPTVASAADAVWAFWVARDVADEPGAVPAEHARFALWGRAMGRDGALRDAICLAGGADAPTLRPYRPVSCAGVDGTLWLAYEAWDVGAGGVAMHVLRYAQGHWSAPIVLPFAGRAYDPAIAAGADGVLHVAWCSPNRGEEWEQPGTRPGTTADSLRALALPAAEEAADGGSTGSDVWHARLTAVTSGTPADSGVEWSPAQRLNATAGWHLHPSAAVDDQHRVWFTWAALTSTEIYPNLTSDVPYVQTAAARGRRAPWFREARPVVRVRDSRGWHTVAAGPAGALSPEQDGACEPGMVDGAGHTLFPTVLAAGGATCLVIRRYGEAQTTMLDSGEGNARLRAFETAVVPLGREGWQAPEVPHVPEWGGVLAPPAALAVDDAVLVAWQGDLGTRNATSDICLATYRIAQAEPPLVRVELPPSDVPDPRPPAATPLTVTLTAGAYFGNIHMHTEQSFCRRPTSLLLDFNYRWSQDCMRQDFAVLTDHAETKSAYEWWLNRKAAAFYTTPRFAAILGYEWTTRYDPDTGAAHGHVDVYFRGDPPRFWPANAVESNTLPGLWELLAAGERAGYPAFTAAHHPSVSNFRRSWEDWGGDALEPVVEIHQDRRGSFERRGAVGGGVLPPDQLIDGHFVADALARGYTLGFVSGGDHMGISMTGVLADALTREAIFDAIRARRCYAVTGAKVRISLSVEADGRTAGMGQAMSVTPEGAEARLRADVMAPSAIRRLVVVQDGVDAYEVTSVGVQSRLDTRLHVRGGGYCYLRVELADGELAWTSPVFFAAA